MLSVTKNNLIIYGCELPKTTQLYVVVSYQEQSSYMLL